MVRFGYGTNTRPPPLLLATNNKQSFNGIIQGSMLKSIRAMDEDGMSQEDDDGTSASNYNRTGEDEGDAGLSL